MQTRASEDVSKYGPPPQYPIESVDNALRLLLLFETQPSIRLTDASNYLAVASSTAHRLMGMLLYRGFVRQNPATKAYEPGQALGSIAFAIRRQIDVRTLARPVLERLFKETGETVHFARLEGTDAHFLDAIESSRAVRVGSRQGRTLPANCTATGKAMLSRLSDEQLRMLYPQLELPGLTKASITSRADLEVALEKIRHTGYASSHEESEDGVNSVAVAITGPSGVLYGINVSVPAHRMSDQLRVELGAMLQSIAEELQGLLI
ncbi:IclR family transcriptional regulator [Pseudarthrobacter raffinosi]|uniref:IclR family transcriptional regulator n=1 Tax=Pseudarthrobacter raffinosi TaxID=2953651 RepID=UPI00208F216C|nr:MULTISPECIES: IclR family transcriptional regulator [unclassified Pseudarthrobacter]MCO4251570.1 IclR family transcriptional regulator [Pseudarthrobacter sp. MDT3-9]MCO4264581.1 IclR family transcriptional regulator [Pseudarthrobacter sp. MDT3-26]